MFSKGLEAIWGLSPASLSNVILYDLFPASAFERHRVNISTHSGKAPGFPFQGHQHPAQPKTTTTGSHLEKQNQQEDRHS